MLNPRVSPHFLQLLDLYADGGYKAKIRVFQRWFVGTPYEIIETYVPEEGLIIDLGCGIGLFANLLVLKASGRNVLGIDGDRAKMAVARQTVKQRPNIEFRCADLREFELHRCRGIVLYDVLHHLEPDLQVKILEQSFTALEDGGRLVIKENDTEPCWKLWVNYFIEWLALGFDLTKSAPICYRDRQAWVDMVIEVGFHLVTAQHVPYWHPWSHCVMVFQKLADYCHSERHSSGTD